MQEYILKLPYSGQLIINIFGNPLYSIYYVIDCILIKLVDYH